MKTLREACTESCSSNSSSFWLPNKYRWVWQNLQELLLRWSPKHNFVGEAWWSNSFSCGSWFEFFIRDCDFQRWWTIFFLFFWSVNAVSNLKWFVNHFVLCEFICQFHVIRNRLQFHVFVKEFWKLFVINVLKRRIFFPLQSCIGDLVLSTINV